MRIRHLGCMAAMAALLGSTAMAAGKCQLQQLGTMPVDMQGLRPLVSTQINGDEARFLLDTGSFYSSMSRHAAEQYHLPVGSLSGRSSMREFDRALADLTHACELAPNSAQNHFVRGQVHIGVGNLRGAVRDYDSALDIAAEWPRLRILAAHPPQRPPVRGG